MPVYLRDEKFMKQFGKRLRRIRRSRDLTINQLGDLSGIRPNHIDLIERAEVNTSISHVFFLAKALDITPKDLFDFDDNEFKLNI